MKSEKIAKKDWTMVRIGTVREMSEQQPEFWHSKLVVRLCENKMGSRIVQPMTDCKPVQKIGRKQVHALAKGGCWS